MKLTNVLQHETEFLKLCEDSSLLSELPEGNADKLRKILDLVVMNYDLIDGFGYNNDEKVEIKELMSKCKDDNDAYNMVFEKMASSHEDLDLEQEKAEDLSKN